MALPNDKRSLQDRLSRVATRMAQKFGNGVFTGVTVGAGASAGIPASVLINRIAGKKVALDSLGRENASALSFTVIDTANGATAATQDQLVASTYIQDNFPIGVHGSSTALVMLAKLKAGLDSVDVVVLGDSNAGSPGGDGYVTGIARGLYRGCCAGMYATALWPTGLCYDITTPSGYMALGFRNDNYATVVGAVHQNSGGLTYKDGRSAPNDIKRYMNPSNFSLGWGAGYPSSVANNPTTNFVWADVAGICYAQSAYFNVYEWRNTSISEFNAGLDTRNSLTYRVVHSLMPGVTSGVTAPSLRLLIRGACTAANYQSPFGAANFTFAPGSASAPGVGFKVFTANGPQGATGITASKYTWNADSNRVGVPVAANFLGLGPGYTGSYGPFAVYMESMHCNKKGWAVTGLAYLSGWTTDGIADSVVGFAARTDSSVENGMRTFLREARERQIEAGGSGNVIVFLNSGINDVGGIAGFNESAAASVYPTHLQRIVTAFKQEWDGLGYPENDLAFLITVSAPSKNAIAENPVLDWNLDSLRVAGKNYAQTSPDYAVLNPYSNVTFVDFTKLGTYGLTMGGLSAGNSWSGFASFYSDDGLNVHLSPGATGGYAYIGELLINRCLRYASSIG